MAVGAVLAVASFGLNLFGAGQQKKQAKQQAKFTQQSEELSRSLVAAGERTALGDLERRLRGTLGTQAAGFGFSGIAGGGTPAAFAADAEAAAARERAAIELTARTETELSIQAQKAGVARAAAQSAQANIDLFGKGLDTFDKLNTIRGLKGAQT